MQQLFPWSCLTASFAYALGISERELHEHLGHDGSKIIASDLPPPKDRVAFHPQELIDFCADNMIRVIHIQANPGYALENGTEYAIWPLSVCQKRIERYLAKHSGVVTGRMLGSGKMHAVFWDCFHKLLIDPNGLHYPMQRMEIHDFFAVRQAPLHYCEICQGACRG